MQLTAKELKRLIREEFVRTKIKEAQPEPEQPAEQPAAQAPSVDDDRDMASMFEDSGLTKEDIKNIILEALNEKE